MAKKRMTSDLINQAETRDRRRNAQENLARYRKQEAAAMKALGMFYPSRPSAVDVFGNTEVNPMMKTVGGAGGRTLRSPSALREGAERRVGKTKRKK